MNAIHVLTIMSSSLVSSVFVLIVFSTQSRRRSNSLRGVFSDLSVGCVFLFDEFRLVDASVNARALLEASRLTGGDWASFLNYVTPRFPEFDQRLKSLPSIGRFSLTSGTTPLMTLRAEFRGGLTRILIAEPRVEGNPGQPDQLSLRAMEQEIELLRNTMDEAPILIWRETESGSVSWANRAYVDLATQLDPDSESFTWPIPRVFSDTSARDIAANDGQRRLCISSPDIEAARWFECRAVQYAADHLAFALPADSAVRAETSLRSFVQTLTKTFAHLTIGLAIFDRQRQLVLFNPSLIDLTGLSPEFLSSRPTLFALLDAMREHQMIPEPKDYKTWRNRMTALERAASSGQYEETWTLPNGQTYRVTGRPHPDGAIAFVFDDISDQMLMARSFRAETELSQSVIDNLSEAVVVFSSLGKLILANIAYTRLWGLDHAGDAPKGTLTDAAGLWAAACTPDPVIDEIVQSLGPMASRDTLSAELRLIDGRLLTCRVAHLPGGATMVGFNTVTALGPQRTDRPANVSRQRA